MKVISHQTIRVHLPISLLARFGQSRQKHLAVFVLEKYLLAPITAAQHMVNCPFVLHTRFSGHVSQNVREILFRQYFNITRCGTDPLTIANAAFVQSPVDLSILRPRQSYPKLSRRRESEGAPERLSIEIRRFSASHLF